MKKLKLVGILVAVVLIGGVISISFINNNIAYKVEKELCETPLPEKTELIESISRAGKLTGNGNGMQYFGAILIQSELSLKELDDYYSDHRSNEWEYLVEIQEGQSIDVIDHETLNFGKEINDAGYYIYEDIKKGAISMKKFMLCIMGSLIALFVVFWCCISYTVNYKKITCDTSVSPDKKYEVILQAVGEPEWPFGSASGRLVLKEGEDKISQTDFELHNDGASISSSCWKVTWHEDYVEIILSGEEQFDEQVILYFDGTKEIQQLTDVADIEVEYPSGERLDESRVITEQSFDVELNDWGEVQFVSYLPTYETLWEDVSFVLAKDNQIIYYFPECYENNSTENDSVGMFDSVEAVGFQDIDGDGAKDVIVIINYVTGAGPQGMMPRKIIRIFSSQDNGFVIQHDLMDELMENMKEDDISIPAICDYVTLMETNEIYDGYRTIYQQYFADEGCDFMISYGANGNSRVILNENEEIIEYLVYDRLSENEKCELYVLYRSKKNTDGSWYISEAEILDIFAYSMSTKDVVSSGKTSWSATGSEEHEIN